MESLLLDVPFVCKLWYKASLDPKCWERLIFPKYIKPDDIWDKSPLGERLMMEYQESFCVTAFIKSPSLKALRLHDDLLFKKSTIIPKLISKWKNLVMLSLGSTHNMEEILALISLHCNNFIMLFAPRIYVGKDEATSIVTSLPNLKYLVLKGSTIERENLVTVLQGCKKLLRLDVRKWIGFEENDAEILALASYIPTFMCKGSILYDYDDEPLTYKDADFAPDYHYV
ncbi:hypothetical protein PVL29_009620 [Vitis rotundifolia]|uniref:F-box/LRR-repeat protein n=1 Tax=Vitis rotundifolia TaxID=103349 RepID=A0AA38ZSV4_VITRO|nr:hypothetical protein PVL29_009620 [Vitis rotundifolia]